MNDLKTPDQTLNDVNSARMLLAQTTTDSIASALVKEYSGDAVEIFVNGYKSKFEKILPILQKVFKEKGWHIIISDRSFSDQRDGDQTCFRVSAINYASPA